MQISQIQFPQTADYLSLRQALSVLKQLLGARPAWVVGGTLRDLVIGRALQDVDLVVDQPAIALAQTLANQLNASLVVLDAARDIGRVVLHDGNYLDLAHLRAADLAGDLADRDFTINAMAAPLFEQAQLGQLIDPHAGLADIQSATVRMVQANALANDPLRMLRAVRIAAQLGWQLDPATDQAIRAHAETITQVAVERVRVELLAILATRWSASWLRYLDRANLLPSIIPEIRPMYHHTQPNIHFLDVWEHSLETITAGEWLLAQLEHDQQPAPPAPPALADDWHPPAFFQQPATLRMLPNLSLQLQWAAQVVAQIQQPIGNTASHRALWKMAILLHDCAKPATRVDKPDGSVSFHEHQTVGAEIARGVYQRLRFSNQEIEYMGKVIAGHMRPGQLYSQPETSAKAAYRFFRDLKESAVDTLLHALADHMATRGPLLQEHHWAYQAAWTDAMLGFHWDAEAQQKRAPLVDGHTLMQELGLPAGPQIGTLLEAIREAQAAGEVTDRESALALARRLHA